MSVYRTNGSIIVQPVGIPQPSGLVYVTTGGTLYGSLPVGEPPGGVNSTPGIVSAALTWTNTAWTQPAPGLPYGFSAPIYIGQTS